MAVVPVVQAYPAQAQGYQEAPGGYAPASAAGYAPASQASYANASQATWQPAPQVQEGLEPTRGMDSFHSE